MKFTILGCGSSMGVPRPALGWGACDPKNPKNRRRRTSLLVERKGTSKRGTSESGTSESDKGTTTILIDTSPDLREQLIDADVSWVDGVLMTHDHADHCHGIDDLRALFVAKRRRVDVYANQETAKTLRERFGYCFATPAGSQYPPIAREHLISAGEPVTIDGEGGSITALPILQQHGDIPSLGFRFGAFAYSCDLNDMPSESAAALAGVEVWVIDALRYNPHPSHFSLADALKWIERIKPKRAILTNMHSDLDYEKLRAELPPHVEPAYDGISVTLKG